MKEQVQSDIPRLGEARVLFGHQSVGANVLEGVRELAASTGAEVPRIVEPADAHHVSGSILIDQSLGRNGDPDSKCGDFIRAVESFAKEGLDVVAMKLCHADFVPGMDVRSLFEKYCRTVDSIRSSYTGLSVVHCTVPLTARTAFWRRAAKWVLGRDDLSDVGNTLRLEYNDLLRERYRDEPVFDIARCESTLPDGSRSSFQANGRTIYTLAWEYASDTGHLNQLGRRVTAEEFLRVIAQALALRKNSPAPGVKPALQNR